MVEGHVDAPVLAVMPYAPDEGMVSWFYERMRECGIRKTDICIIYILEEPPENSGGRPSVRQIREAMDRTAKDVAESNPKVVIPFGNVALDLLTGIKEPAEDARGYLIPPTLRGTLVRETHEQIGAYKTANKTVGRKVGDPKFGWVKRASKGLLPETYQGWVIPSYELYTIQSSGFSLNPAFKADMKRVARALAGTLDIVDYGFTFYTDLTAENGDDYTSRVLAVDIETDWDTTRIIERVSVSDGVRTHTLPWTEDTRVWLNRQLTIPRDWIIFHNGPFDIPRLRESGIVLTPEMEERCIFDSMFGGVCALPDLPKGLGKMASVYLDTLPWKWKSLRDKNPLLYSAKDAYVTALLFLRGLEPMLTKMGMWPLVTGREYKWGPGVMATIPVLSEMSEIGIRKNRVFAEDWSNRLKPVVLGYLQQWSVMFPDVDPASNPNVLKLFYHTWKLPIIRTKKEGVTVNEFAVMKAKLYTQSEYARRMDLGPWRSDPRCKPETFDLLLSIREVSKLLSTYCTPILDGPMNYVHPSYLPASKDAEGQSKGAAATGRLASSGELNIQNQPNPKKPGPGREARGIFIPDTPGMCFVQGDYEKAELWGMAAMAGDDVMLADLASGDPYQRVADEAGTDRSTAKNVLLAGQYLAGPPKMSEMILKQQHIYVEPAECKRITSLLASRWVKRTAYVRYLIEQCRIRGYLVNPFGRLRVFHDRRAAAAVDYIPQSIVADILWCVLRDVSSFAKALGGRLTTTVHDSILVQVPEASVPECIAGMRRIMERRFDCVAPNFFIPVGFEVGKAGASWLELKPV